MLLIGLKNRLGKQGHFVVALRRSLSWLAQGASQVRQTSSALEDGNAISKKKEK